MFSTQKVTVISVVHNHARFLKTAFKSFAYQDYQNMEWIIVNDASTDNSARLLQRYRVRDDRVKLCLNKTYRGYADSYEFAIGKASGDYIAFLEPENIWIKNKISRQLGFMKRYDAVLSHSSYAFADIACNLLPTGCCHIEPMVNLINFRKETDICLSAFMMKKEEICDLFPIEKKDEKTDILMYLMQKGLVSQGMSDVLTLCRPNYSYPTRKKSIENIKKLYQQMTDENVNIPSLMRYQAYKALNVASIKMEPSSCIGRDVPESLEELKNFKL